MTETVKVGCKLPSGLVMSVGDVDVVLNGANSSNLINGHGITEVPKAHWEAWAKEYADRELIKGGHIFAHTKAENVAAEAKEKKGLKTGLEQVKPDKNSGVTDADKD